jgi:hypothetical protein
LDAQEPGTRLRLVVYRACGALASLFSFLKLKVTEIEIFGCLTPNLTFSHSSKVR